MMAALPELPGTVDTVQLFGKESRFAHAYTGGVLQVLARRYTVDRQDNGHMLHCMAAAMDTDTWVAERKDTRRFPQESDNHTLAAYDRRTAVCYLCLALHQLLVQRLLGTAHQEEAGLLAEEGVRLRHSLMKMQNGFSELVAVAQWPVFLQQSRKASTRPLQDLAELREHEIEYYGRLITKMFRARATGGYVGILHDLPEPGVVCNQRPPFVNFYKS